MRRAKSTPLLSRGDGPDSERPAEASDSERAARRRRWGALLAAAALPIAMLAPWYSLRVSARAPSGDEAFTQQLSGWDALSGAAIACLIVAIGVCALIAVRSIRDVSGLGAEGRRAARARIDGGLIAGAGLLCVVTLLWTAVAPPATTAGAVAVSTHTTARWGVLLALVLAAMLTATGVQILAAAGRNLRDRRPGRSRMHRRPAQPAPGRSTNENSVLSTPTMRIPSTISQRRRVT